MAEVLNFYKIGKVIPEGAEYIGRAMPHLSLKASKFANPFKLQEGEPRGSTIARYREWLWDQIKSGKITLEDLLELEGKDLVCYCAPQACHGDILLEAVRWARKKYSALYGHWDWEENL